MKRMIWILLGLLGFVAIAFAVLLFMTHTPPTVPATVMNDASLPRVQGAGVVLHGRIVGAKDVPLIIVLHGGPGNDHRSLLGLEKLTDTHRILFYDQRGAGLSERIAPEKLDITHHLADLDRLIEEHARNAPVTLLGHSMGATMAVAYIGHAPDRVKQAILIEPGFLDMSGYEAFEAKRIKLSRSPHVIWASILAGFRARGVTTDVYAGHDSIIGAAVHAFANHPRNPYHCGNGFTAPSWRFGGIASDTFWADVEPTLNAVEAGLKFKGPIMIMAGECNHWIGPNLQLKHAERFAIAELKIVADAGHDVIWDQPDQAIGMIREFLER